MLCARPVAVDVRLQGIAPDGVFTPSLDVREAVVDTFRPRRRQDGAGSDVVQTSRPRDVTPSRWRSLQVRVMAVVSLGVLTGASAAVVADARQITREHRAAVGRELTGVARTFGFGLSPLEQADPARLQAQLVALQRLHGLDKVTAYRLEPDGTVRRVASTELAGIGQALPARSGDAAAMRSGGTVYEEERVGGRHVAEVVHAVPASEGGGPVIGVGFYKDLAASDAALAHRQRVAAATIAAAALAAALALALLLRRLVVVPLRQIQVAMHAVRSGALHSRLGWRRADELGALARDFDDMAAELQRSHDQLISHALEDELTGLPNRRAARTRLTAEVAAAQREGAQLAVVLLDVDHFKTINDTWGHGVGDEVLRALAKAAQLSLRPGDLAARLGGDEFLLLLRGADAAAATDVADRLAEVIACLRAAPDGSAFTVSAGIATYPTDASGEQQLLDRADQALYRAKANGRAQAAAWLIDQRPAHSDRPAEV